jgi:hypothetical protein
MAIGSIDRKAGRRLPNFPPRKKPTSKRLRGKREFAHVGTSALGGA